MSLFKWVVDEAMARTKADQSYVALLEGDRFSIKYSQGEDHERFLALTIREGTVGHAARSGEPYFCTNTKLDPYFVGSSRVVHEIVVPLRDDNNNVVGVLLVDSFNGETFERETVHVLDELGKEFIARQRKELFYQESPILLDSARKVVAEALAILGGDQAYLALKESDRMQILYSQGDEEDRFLSLTIHEGVAGRAARTGKSQRWVRGQQDDDYVESSAHVVEEIVTPIVVDSIEGDQEVVGVLLLDSFKTGVLGENKLAELEALAQSFASAYPLFQPPIDLAQALLRSRLKRHFGPQDTDVIVREGGALQFKPRRVTVLFADVRNFSSAAAHIQDPELLGEFVVRYYGEMRAIVHNHRGAIDKYIGDGVMAVFGILGADDKRATEQAVEAALQMQERFEQLLIDFSGEVERKLGFSLQDELSLGCALHTGEALVGFPRGSRFDLTTIGKNVNVAAKLEKSFKGAAIRISGVTKAVVADLFIVESLGIEEIGNEKYPVYNIKGRKGRKPKG